MKKTYKYCMLIVTVTLRLLDKTVFQVDFTHSSCSVQKVFP